MVHIQNEVKVATKRTFPYISARARPKRGGLAHGLCEFFARVNLAVRPSSLSSVAHQSSPLQPVIKTRPISFHPPTTGTPRKSPKSLIMRLRSTAAVRRSLREVPTRPSRPRFGYINTLVFVREVRSASLILYDSYSHSLYYHYLLASAIRYNRVSGSLPTPPTQ